MKRMLSFGGLLGVITAAGALAASGSAAAGGSLCVDLNRPGCFTAIQPALNAAQVGDTIEIGVGMFAGGITITKSVQLVGISAPATVISGGGPVITIGDGVGKPTVSISHVTVTGGFNDSVPDPASPRGGGVFIQSANGATGATVTISDSIITGNRVSPRVTAPPGTCSYVCAFARGGGIADFGTLTVENTEINDNVAGSTVNDGSVASDANGGGIHIAPVGTVLLQHVMVSGNRAAVSAPNGRFSNGGAIVDNGGALTIEDGSIDGNSSITTADVPSVFPADVEQEANAAGIWITEVPGASATITRSTISGNHVVGTNSGGDEQAENGGIDNDGTLVLTDSSIDHNTVVGRVPAASGFLAGAIDGGLQTQGVATITNSRIADNSLSATSENGTANVAGAGIGNINGALTLNRTLVTANDGTATGASGLALGGGILNIAFFGSPPTLTLTDSVITANTLTASPGITVQGGGLYTLDLFGSGAFPVTLTQTVIEGNQPDQCVGC
jgi:hypothetical protein